MRTPKPMSKWIRLSAHLTRCSPVPRWRTTKSAASPRSTPGAWGAGASPTHDHHTRCGREARQPPKLAKRCAGALPAGVDVAVCVRGTVRPRSSAREAARESAGPQAGGWHIGRKGCRDRGGGANHGKRLVKPLSSGAPPPPPPQKVVDTKSIIGEKNAGRRVGGWGGNILCVLFGVWGGVIVLFGGSKIVIGG